MSVISTPHIRAEEGAIAKTVLLPGDPLRSEFIAKTFLRDAVLVNDIRGVHGYTGKFKGTEVTVMASGMGMPSMGIYSYELFNFFGVGNILRIGSAGGLSEKVHLRDIVIAMGASTTSAYARQFGLGGDFAPLCSYELLRLAVEEAENAGARYAVGNVLTSDVFYNADPHFNDGWRDMGCLAVEMETAALYMNAARAKKNALAICTVSDHIYTGEELSAEERQTSFTEMMEIALNVAHRLDRENG